MSTTITHTEKKKTLAPKLRFKGFDDSWSQKKLNTVVEINPSNKNLPEKFIYIDLESVVKGQLLKENEILKDGSPSRAQRYLKQNDILFQMVRPYQMNNLFFDKNGDYVASTGYAQIRTKENSKYIYQYLHLQTFVDNVIEKCTGTSYPSINSKDLGSIQIGFPTLPEQQKIASFLSAVDEKIQQLTRKKELLEQYKKGVMQQLFLGKLRFKDENGKAYPGWKKNTIDGITQIGRGKNINSSHEGKYFLLGMGAVSVDGKLLTNNKTEYAEEFLVKNDLIMPERDIGVGLIIGQVAIIDENNKYILGSNLLRLTVDKSCSYRFVYYLINDLRFRKKIKRLVNGSAQLMITAKDVKKLNILLPCIEEQNKIANYLSNIDNKIESVTKQITQTQNFKKGLLQQMFV